MVRKWGNDKDGGRVGSVPPDSPLNCHGGNLTVGCLGTIGWTGAVCRFVPPGRNAYLRPMPKPIELPLGVAKAFVKDMRAFFAAGGTGAKADEIAASQLHALRAWQGPREKKLHLIDVKQMFLEMKDEA